MLNATPIQERSLLEQDRRVFELVLDNETFRSAQFSDESGRSVRIYIVDKTNLETILGVDLVIYNICYNSFLLLQYKGMHKHGDSWAFPVDDQMKSQIEVMSGFRDAAAKMPPTSHTLWSYRLNEEPFYFKFCERVRPTARNESLSRSAEVFRHG